MSCVCCWSVQKGVCKKKAQFRYYEYQNVKNNGITTRRRVGGTFLEDIEMDIDTGAFERISVPPILESQRSTVLHDFETVIFWSQWLFCSKKGWGIHTINKLVWNWLPVRRHVEFKVACLVDQLLSGQAPVYLAGDCRLVSETVWRALWSANFMTCGDADTKQLRWQEFAVADPCLWYNLPPSPRCEYGYEQS